ncbi:MAG: NUDIX hydrolase [Proteobacteria bacterium]|nr:NUDIX hydrolase [Pseudomonadota bacterium]MBI3496484.1 NUDIX hydrolase [Pseudomonadota bacterium]
MGSDPTPKGPSVPRIPEGDDRLRLVCPDCGFINYENPKIVVGSVARWEERILMVRRSIEPRSGFWTLPAGYLELNETTEAGALREAEEEANALIEIEGLLAVYSIPRISQVQLIYRARLISPDVAPGREAHEVALYHWPEIPWADIAFPSVNWALQHFRDSLATPHWTPRTNPPEHAAS